MFIVWLLKVVVLVLLSSVPLFMVAQDRFSEIDPVYWYFWLGVLMVAVVLFARGGVLGLIERLLRR